MINLQEVQVKHNIFGEGIIKWNDENHLVVRFSQGDKKFVYPDAFENFIFVSDNKITEFINEEIENKKMKKIKQLQNFFPNKETLLTIKRDQEDKIKEIVTRRKVEYLLHFTRIDNLNSILKNGLIPVSMQQKMKISSVNNDEHRIDSKLDCTSCSISFPNYKLFYAFRECRFPGTSWIVLVLDKDVLFSSSNIAYYCKTNAAGIFPLISSTIELCTATALENMFVTLLQKRVS